MYSKEPRTQAPKSLRPGTVRPPPAAPEAPCGLGSEEEADLLNIKKVVGAQGVVSTGPQLQPGNLALRSFFVRCRMRGHISAAPKGYLGRSKTEAFDSQGPQVDSLGPPIEMLSKPGMFEPDILSICLMEGLATDRWQCCLIQVLTNMFSQSSKNASLPAKAELGT